MTHEAREPLGDPEAWATPPAPPAAEPDGGPATIESKFDPLRDEQAAAAMNRGVEATDGDLIEETPAAMELPSQRQAQRGP